MFQAFRAASPPGYLSTSMAAASVRLLLPDWAAPKYYEKLGMDWFEKIAGFREVDYEDTRRRLSVDAGRLHSTANGMSYAIGWLEVPSLQELRERVHAGGGLPGHLRVSCLGRDVRELHRLPAFRGALFQVASQFNLLEMTGPLVTPEDGVTRYAHDRTQGPACAIAAGAATIFRNYFVPVGGRIGQSASNQVNCLADLGEMLSDKLHQSVDSLWSMQNGYALCTRDGLKAIEGYIARQPTDRLNALRDALRVGVHWDVEVTDQTVAPGPIVSQVFCSALPVAYSSIPASHWKAFASLVLEGAYEATLLAAVCNAQRGGPTIVLLTRLGGGAFGNHREWIDAALLRALRVCAGFALDVKLVSLDGPSVSDEAIVKQFQA